MPATIVQGSPGSSLNRLHFGGCSGEGPYGKVCVCRYDLSNMPQASI